MPNFNACLQMVTKELEAKVWIFTMLSVLSRTRFNSWHYQANQAPHWRKVWSWQANLARLAKAEQTRSSQIIKVADNGPGAEHCSCIVVELIIVLGSQIFVLDAALRLCLFLQWSTPNCSVCDLTSFFLCGSQRRPTALNRPKCSKYCWFHITMINFCQAPT